jgi:transposase
MITWFLVYVFIMKKVDARKLSRKMLHKKRKQVISLFQAGTPIMKIVEETGLSWPAVKVAIQSHEENLSLEPSRRGKKQGTGRVLSEEQEARLCKIIYKKRPWQVRLRISSRKLSLWNRDAVRQLIEQECGIKLSVRCVAKYLERWGFPLMKQNQRPRERCPWYIERWLAEYYNEIENRAKTENMGIYWVCKKTVIPVKNKQMPQKNPIPNKLSMISAISNQGKEHWVIIKGIYNQERQINFLKALVSDQMKPITLIRNNSDYYTEKPVLDWVEENKIEVFPPLLPKELAKKEKKKINRKIENFAVDFVTKPDSAPHV